VNFNNNFNDVAPISPIGVFLGRGEPPPQTPPLVPLTLTPTLNNIFFLGGSRAPILLPQGVVFGAITATNPYYCCGIEY